MRFSTALVLLAALSGCGTRDPVVDNADGAMLSAPVNNHSPDASGAPPSNQAMANNAVAPAAGEAIPAALHGRWGLTPGDCTSARRDAKGLMVISDGDLRFYESRAVPAAGAEAHEDRIDGQFDFTGEGQSWRRFEALKVNGNKLTRTESNPTASFTYAKC